MFLTRLRHLLTRLLRQNVDWLLPIVAVALGLAMYLFDPPIVQVLRNTVFDEYQRRFPRTYQDMPVRVVDIDEASLAKLGQWPWPRTRLAELTDRLRQAGAAAIVYDMMFAEPDRTSPRAIMKDWQVAPEARELLAGLPDHDAVFRRSIAKGQVVLGHALTNDGDPKVHLAKPFRIIQLGPSPLAFLPEFKSTAAALDILQDVAAGNGAVTFVPDTDGVIRRVPLVLRLGDKVVPSLVAEALRVAQEDRNIFLKTSEEAHAGIEEVRIGALTIPVTRDGEFWVHYTPPESSRYLPAWEVLSGGAAASQLEGRIILVGSSAQGLMDLRFNPMGGSMPGVEAHAQALEQILSGETLSRPAWIPAVEALVIVLGGLAVGFIAMYVGALLSAGVAMVLLVLTILGGWYAYLSYGLLMDPVVPGLAMLLVFGLASLFHHRTTERRQRWVREAFAHYLSPNLVDYLVKNPAQLELGGSRRECSFIFTDLASFTNLMEKLDPTEAVKLLNGYLDNMIRIAFQHHGTLDRIVGDAVAIMFSAPIEQKDHRRRALACALDMYRFASSYAAEANARGIPFGSTRIGLHTGEVTVGNFGGSTIFDYRALGDPVNTAARLESVNKQLGTWVCVSEDTLSGAPDTPTRPIGRLVLKGKTEPLMVYEPLFAPASATVVQDDAYLAAYQLLKASSPQALAEFEALAASRPDDGLVQFHLRRLRSGQQGEVIVFTEK